MSERKVGPDGREFSLWQLVADLYDEYQPCCDECGQEFWADDPDDEAVCPECAAEKCSECGEPLDDGEGYDGKCGNCADRAEGREFTTADEP